MAAARVDEPATSQAEHEAGPGSAGGPADEVAATAEPVPDDPVGAVPALGDTAREGDEHPDHGWPGTPAAVEPAAQLPDAAAPTAGFAWWAAPAAAEIAPGDAPAWLSPPVQEATAPEGAAGPLASDDPSPAVSGDAWFAPVTPVTAEATAPEDGERGVAAAPAATERDGSEAVEPSARWGQQPDASPATDPTEGPGQGRSSEPASHEPLHPDDWFDPPRPPRPDPARVTAMSLLLRRLLRRRVRIRAGGHRLRGVLVRVRAEYATLATADRHVRVVHVVLRQIVAVELE